MCVLLHNIGYYASILCVFLVKENEMNNQLKFIERQIAEWEAKSKEASENADFKAFEFAESEIKNYQAMLKTYEQPAT